MKKFQMSMFLKLLVFTFFSLKGCINTFGQTVICPKEKIVGLDKEYNRAIFFLKATKADIATSNIRKVTVYITYGKTQERDFLYFHSNYRPEGNPYPIKIATNESLDLHLIISNIININRQHSEFALAFEKYIRFAFDYRIFHHVKFKNIDFGKARNIEIVDANGIIKANGFKIYETQQELKKMNYFVGDPDGMPGKNTDDAMLLFKKKYGLDYNRDFFIFSRKNKKVISFKESADFLKEFELSNENCNKSLSICIDNNFVASFVVDCNNQQLEFSTEGGLTLTATYKKEVYSFSPNGDQNKANYVCSNLANNSVYENSVDFLKCYENRYFEFKERCENSVKLCLGKDTSISMEVNCNGSKMNVSTSGSISLTASNGRSSSVQF